MANLGLAGIASGVDTNAIVDQLMALERQSLTRLGYRQAALTGQQNALKDVASKLAALERLHDVPVELAVEIGRTQLTIRETLALGPGSIVTRDRLAGEPVDLLVNGKPIARGEVVVIDEEFGLRVTEVVADAASAPAAEPEQA
jgi:flagellar motor switch protein FliN